MTGWPSTVGGADGCNSAGGASDCDGAGSGLLGDEIVGGALVKKGEEGGATNGDSHLYRLLGAHAGDGLFSCVVLRVGAVTVARSRRKMH